MVQEKIQWPRWPDDVAGKRLVGVEVAGPADKVFETLFGTASAFVLKSHEARGNKDYGETPWLPSESELEGQQLQASSSSERKANGTKSSIAKGCVRRVGFSAAGIGIKYKTEELQRLVEAQPGKQYVVEGCVSTTATYGESFRPVTRTRLTAAANGKSCELLIESTLVYIAPVNKFVRTMIERGADSGMAKNFAQLMELLGKEFQVTSLAEGQRTTAAEASAAGPAPAGKGARLWAGALDAELAASLEPLASWIRARLQPGYAARPAADQGERAPSMLAQGLAATLLIATVSIVLRWLHSAATACQQLRGSFGGVCRQLLRFLPLPSSTAAVIAGCLLVAALQMALACAMSFVPDILEAVKTRRAAVMQQATAPEPLSPTAANGSPEEAPKKGVRFKGYDSAFQTSIQEAKPDPVPAAQVSSPIQQTVKVVQDMWRDSFTAILNQAATLSPRSAGALSPRSSSTPPSEKPSEQAPEPGSPGNVSEVHASLPQRPASMSTLSRGTAGSAPGSRPSRAAADATEQPAEQDGSVQGSDSPAASEKSEPGPRLEEVYENERAQPFRGWGHSWPGHFLPTDRVGHWSERSGAPGGKLSMSFRAVAPNLRPGYEWEEDKWHVDLNGLAAEAVDAEGWSYAVDFHWMYDPPPPGTGRMKVTDFVRRRRWIRTQRPVPPAADANGESAGEPGSASPRKRPIQLLEALSYPAPAKPLPVPNQVRSGSSSPPLSPPRPQPDICTAGPPVTSSAQEQDGTGRADRPAARSLPVEDAESASSTLPRLATGAAADVPVDQGKEALADADVAIVQEQQQRQQDAAVDSSTTSQSATVPQSPRSQAQQQQRNAAKAPSAKASSFRISIPSWLRAPGSPTVNSPSAAPLKPASMGGGRMEPEQAAAAARLLMAEPAAASSPPSRDSGHLASPPHSPPSQPAAPDRAHWPAPASPSRVAAVAEHASTAGTAAPDRDVASGIAADALQDSTQSTAPAAAAAAAQCRGDAASPAEAVATSVHSAAESPDSEDDVGTDERWSITQPPPQQRMSEQGGGTSAHQVPSAAADAGAAALQERPSAAHSAATAATQADSPAADVGAAAAHRAASDATEQEVQIKSPALQQTASDESNLPGEPQIEGPLPPASPEAEAAQVPSHLEDALARRTFLDISAALGSAGSDAGSFADARSNRGSTATKSALPLQPKDERDTDHELTVASSEEQMALQQMPAAQRSNLGDLDEISEVDNAPEHDRLDAAATAGGNAAAPI